MAQPALPHCLGLPYGHHQLVLSCYPHQPESHQLSLHIVLDWVTSGSIDRTPGTPGSDNHSVIIYRVLFNWNPPKVSVYIVNHSVNNYLLADTRLRYATTTFLYSCNITCCIYQTLINHQKGNRKIIFCCCCIDKHQLSCENPVRKNDFFAMHIKSEHWTPQKTLFTCDLFLRLSAWWTSVGLSVCLSL